MNIDVASRGKPEDIEQLNEHAPEKINANFDALTQDMASVIVALEDYEVDLETDVSGELPLANLTGGIDGYVLVGQGTSTAPTYESINNQFIPAIGGSFSAGKRVAWFQKANGTNDSTLASVGHAALAFTGGSGTFDNDGHWGTPISALGGLARYTGDLFTRTELLPTFAVRLRTSASAADLRIRVGLTEGSAVDADDPNSSTQEGLYFRYSTADSDAGWIAQAVGGGAITESSSIVAFAATTIYYMTIVVNSTTSVTFSINGTSTTLTTNIPTSTNLRIEILVRSLNAVAVQSFSVESMYLISN